MAENRATGIPTMIRQARRYGLPRPAFASTVLSFPVTLSRSELLAPEVRAWIASTVGTLPSPTHEVAVAMLRNAPLTNAMLREWGADRIEAGQVLHDLVDRGIAIKEGGRRYAHYLLDPRLLRPAPPREVNRTGRGRTIRSIIEELGSATAAEIQRRAGVSRPTVLSHLRTLHDEGLVAVDGAPNSPKRRYRWVGGTRP